MNTLPAAFSETRVSSYKAADLTSHVNVGGPTGCCKGILLGRKHRLLRAAYHTSSGLRWKRRAILPTTRTTNHMPFFFFRCRQGYRSWVAVSRGPGFHKARAFRAPLPCEKQKSRSGLFHLEPTRSVQASSQRETLHIVKFHSTNTTYQWRTLQKHAPSCAASWALAKDITSVIRSDLSRSLLVTSPTTQLQLGNHATVRTTGRTHRVSTYKLHCTSKLPSSS